MIACKLECVVLVSVVYKFVCVWSMSGSPSMSGLFSQSLSAGPCDGI